MKDLINCSSSFHRNNTDAQTSRILGLLLFKLIKANLTSPMLRPKLVQLGLVQLLELKKFGVIFRRMLITQRGSQQ